jgi:hypothetical protein
MRKIFSKITIVSTICLILLSCATPKKDSEGPTIGDLNEMGKLMPENDAKQAIAEYTGEQWVEAPYLEATVSVYDKDNRFVEKIYQDKVYFKFREMLIGRTVFWGPCLHASVRDLTIWKKEQGVLVVYKLMPKKLCPRYNENQHDLIMAFFHFGANWGTGKWR